MQNFYTLHIDPVSLGIPGATSCEIALLRATVADSFVIVPGFKKRIASLPADCKMIPNDPGSIYEITFFKQGKAESSAFFEMPDHDADIADVDLLSAWPTNETSYALELVAGTNAPDTGQEIGSYAPIRRFSILQSDPHVVRVDSDDQLIVLVDRIRAGVTTTVGQFDASDGEGFLVLLDGPAVFEVGDVLRLVIETCPGDCSRVTATLSVRFGPAS